MSHQSFSSPTCTEFDPRVIVQAIFKGILVRVVAVRKPEVNPTGRDLTELVNVSRCTIYKYILTKILFKLLTLRVRNEKPYCFYEKLFNPKDR